MYDILEMKQLFYSQLLYLHLNNSETFNEVSFKISTTFQHFLINIKLQYFHRRFSPVSFSNQLLNLKNLISFTTSSLKKCPFQAQTRWNIFGPLKGLRDI